jgi:hypothetical protein
MTGREQRLLIVVGVVILGGLAFNFWPRITNSAETNSDSDSRLHEADHLLRFRQNIIVRNDTVNAELKGVQNRFYPAANLESSKLSLLKEVEAIVVQTNLDVQQKNMVNIHDDTIGIALEGKANPESLIRFLQRTTQDRIGLRIGRLQIHSLPDSKQLNYQVTIITLLVK